MLGLGSKKIRSNKREEEAAAAKSCDTYSGSILLGPSTSRTSSFTESREMYTDWTTNSCNSSEELFPNRSTSDESLAGYEHTSDYYRIDTNSTGELRHVAIPAVKDDDDVTKYAMYVHGEESAEVGADLSFESRELTYYGLSDFSSDDATDNSDNYYDVIHSCQTSDEYDDHNGVADSPLPPTPPPITSIPVSRISDTDNNIGTDPPTSEYFACNSRANHTTTSVISNRRGIIPPTPGYLISDIDTDYPVLSVTTSELCTDHSIYALDNDDLDINAVSRPDDYDCMFPKLENIIWKVGPNDNSSMGVNTCSCEFQD